MDEIDYVDTFTVESLRGTGKKIPCRALNRTLKNTRSYKLVTSPLTGKSILTDDIDDVGQLTPWGVLLDDLWSLPAD